MSDLRLDDCSHCACLTPLCGYTREQAIAELDDGTIGCWNCLEDEDGGGHHACVALYDGDEMVWDGRHENGSGPCMALLENDPRPCGLVAHHAGEHKP